MAGIVLNALIRASNAAFPLDAMRHPHDARYKGNAILARNLLIVGSLSLAFPARALAHHGAVMDTPQHRDCPGCGLRLPITEAQPDARYNASPECWHIHGELTAYTVTRGDVEFIHQHLVDAYGAQHVVEHPRPIGPAFALIGLYLFCERGYTGRQVQHMHMLLARRTKTWPSFAPPPAPVGDLTVLDVLHAPPGDERDAVLHRWARSVWDAWRYEHDRVRTLFETVMAG